MSIVTRDFRCEGTYKADAYSDDKPKSTVNRTFQACSDMCVMVNIKNARACFSSSGGL